MSDVVQLALIAALVALANVVARTVCFLRLSGQAPPPAEVRIEGGQTADVLPFAAEPGKAEQFAEAIKGA
jgi:hypothetical protein